MGGFLNLRLKKPIIPTMIIALVFDRSEETLDVLNEWLNVLQSIQIPFALIPLLFLVSSERIMGSFKIGNSLKEWSYLRGGLTTLDRDYGLINNIHHDIGTHVIHHLFPQIPHYNLVEATEAAKPVFGKYYREPKKSGPLPFHLLRVLVESFKKDHYVSDTGDIVYYQTDKKLSGS